MKFLKSIWHTYEIHNTVKNPIKTKMATAFVLFGIGDVICQVGIEKKESDKKYDYFRTLR